MTTTRPNKRQHPPTPIGKVLNKYAISLADMRECLTKEGVQFSSRSTLNRLVHYKTSQAMNDEIYPKLIVCLTKFLTARGLDKSEMDAELTSIFTKGEYQPMITARIELERHECDWFGLERDPFTFPERKEDVFISPPFQRVLDRVFDVLRFPAFLAVTGEIGSGKDVLRGMIEDRVASQQHLNIIWPEFPNQGRIAETHIARAILRHFNYDQPRSIENVAYELKRCLEQEFKSGNRITLGFNECHHLNDTALSSLKNFFEMGSGGFQRWLSVLLIGQPSFATTSIVDKKKVRTGRIYSPKFRELAERIVILEMPTGSDFHPHAAAYLKFRLQRAGAALDLFDQDAIDYIAGNATTPQQLGNIANDAMRISKEDWQNKTVIGAAIETKMFFANTTTEPGYKRRAA